MHITLIEIIIDIREVREAKFYVNVIRYVI